MSAAHDETSRATTGGGGMMVNFTVRVRVKQLKNQALAPLNMENQEADVDWTWAEFFQKTGNVTVDPNMFEVKSQHKQAAFMDDKIRNHIAKYKRVQPLYCVNIVSRIKRERLHKVALAGQKTCSRNNTAKHMPTRSVFPAAVATRTRQNGHPNPKRSHADHIQLNNTRSDPKRFKGGSLNAQERSPSPQTVNVEEEHLPGFDSDGEFGLSSGRRMIFEDSDDAASLFSEMTEYDIRGMGITEEEIKPKVAKKLLQNISNNELLIAKQELNKYAGSKNWMKFVRYNPIAANILTHLFIGPN